MSLKDYNRKRDFDKTAEPEGDQEKSGQLLRFVIQRHHASRLHYDFRLELNGILKSWAVPKGISLNPKDKRLAVLVEDHPISYKDFEGIIPKGNYGAGRVDIWDNGTYLPINDKGEVIKESTFRKHLSEGSIKFRLKGKLAKGEFALVRMKGDDNNWLLIKHKDKYAVTEHYNSEDFVRKEAKSYTSGKRKQKGETPPKKYNKYIKPMLATLCDKPFSDSGWIFEVKWDGYRAISEVQNGAYKLYSRNGLSFHQDYPTIYEELSQIGKECILDGEIVALDENGIPQFQLLQQYNNDSSHPLVYYVFDVLAISGESLKQLPLIKRKEKLHTLLPKSNLIKYCDHIEEKGIEFFQAIENKGLEGMIAKKKDSIYREGSRGKTWLKIKNVLTDEAIIAGYTQPKGSRKYFGALLLGVYDNGMLTYIGHTGTGFTNKQLKEVYNEMQKYKTKEKPFDKKIPLNAPAIWLEPKLVCNIKYTQITQDGLRRHPVFLGLRNDKGSKEVTGDQKLSNKSKSVKTGKNETIKKISGKQVRLTNLDKVYFPDSGYSKADVLGYYESIYRYILKYLKGRPQSLKRNPNGIEGEGFYHKDIGESVPHWMDNYPVWSDSANKEVNYIVCNDKASLLYLANLGCIELNPWLSTIDKISKPDYVVLDLDPSSQNTYDEVVDVACFIKELLEQAGAACYCKTSGASGLHVYVPLQGRYEYDKARDFAHLIATIITERMSETTTIERSLKKRAQNKIYIDYLQNKEGQTLCSAYSLRPIEGAPVSTPLDWKEVKHGLDPLSFNIKNIKKRLDKKGDLFSDVLNKRIDILKVIKNLDK